MIKGSFYKVEVLETRFLSLGNNFFLHPDQRPFHTHTFSMFHVSVWKVNLCHEYRLMIGDLNFVAQVQSICELQRLKAVKDVRGSPRWFTCLPDK